MDRYKTIKIKRFNWWIGLFQGSINIKNCFILHWKWIHKPLMSEETEFYITILGFVLPIVNEHRSLFSFKFHKWNMQDRACNIHFSILYFPCNMFILGNKKTWFSIRYVNYEMYKRQIDVFL